ncbi:hypothetical protein Sjap_013422 [Stephania japonica]|uniref:Uncharacterized protein n=1 Tax=Stephania japonica TaxID=461633 RepID=A0AAP0NZV1_9MAGN
MQNVYKSLKRRHPDGTAYDTTGTSTEEAFPNFREHFTLTSHSNSREVVISWAQETAKQYGFVVIILKSDFCGVGQGRRARL